MYDSRSSLLLLGLLGLLRVATIVQRWLCWLFWFGEEAAGSLWLGLDSSAHHQVNLVLFTLYAHLIVCMAMVPAAEPGWRIWFIWGKDIRWLLLLLQGSLASHELLDYLVWFIDGIWWGGSGGRLVLPYDSIVLVLLYLLRSQQDLHSERRALHFFLVLYRARY